MLGVNSVFLSGRLTMDPKIDVIHREGREGLSVVVLNIVYDHPHDRAKFWKLRKPNYARIRLYGKTAEAAMRNLSKGDEVMVENALMVEDTWIDKITKENRYRVYLEPPPMGLKYVKCKKLGMVFEEKEDKKES